MKTGLKRVMSNSVMIWKKKDNDNNNANNNNANNNANNNNNNNNNDNNNNNNKNKIKKEDKLIPILDKRSSQSAWIYYMFNCCSQ